MRILFLGINYAPEFVGIGAYSSTMCERLAAFGHTVAVVAAKPYYPDWRIHDSYRDGGVRWNLENGVAITRVPLYVPAQPSGLKRLLHHASFALSALAPMLRAARWFRPDVVITVAPSLATGPVALRAAKVAGARSWLHVQDFEVEAAVATGLLKPNSGLTRIARRIERWTLRAFDRVSSISPEMCRKLGKLGVPKDRIIELRNWAEVDLVRPLEGPSPFRAEWGITTPHVALYSGNIGNKQGMEVIIEAAARLRHRNDLTFVVCGQGAMRATLEAQAQGLGNVKFFDLQPKERLGELLGLATLHLLPQRKGAADLLLPSKLTNMLASGRPIVATAEPGTGLARELEGCGLVTRPENGAAFAAAIETLLDSPDLAAGFGQRGRARAESVWHRERILERFNQQLTQLVTDDTGEGRRKWSSGNPVPLTESAPT